MGVLNVSPLRRLHSVIKLSSPGRCSLLSVTSLQFESFLYFRRDICRGSSYKSLALFATWGFVMYGCGSCDASKTSRPPPPSHRCRKSCDPRDCSSPAAAAAAAAAAAKQHFFLILFYPTPITVFIAMHLKVIGVSIMHISFLFCNLNLCPIKVNLKSINWRCIR